MAVESLTNGPPAKRLFVGLQIYGDQAIKLAAMSKEMSVQFTGAAGQRHLWEPDGTGHRHPPDCGGLDTVPYHITLRFLGPVDVSQEPALKAAVAAVADTLPPLMLCLYGCHTFPDRSGLYPKIAWVDVGGKRHQLNLLERALSNAINELGYEPPGHQFLPHVTVGRFDTDDRGLVPQNVGILAQHGALAYQSVRSRCSRTVLHRARRRREDYLRHSRPMAAERGPVGLKRPRVRKETRTWRMKMSGWYRLTGNCPIWR